MGTRTKEYKYIPFPDHKRSNSDLGEFLVGLFTLKTRSSTVRIEFGEVPSEFSSTMVFFNVIFGQNPAFYDKSSLQRDVTRIGLTQVEDISGMFDQHGRNLENDFLSNFIVPSLNAF